MYLEKPSKTRGLYMSVFMKHSFITIEGIDGSGKTTISQWAADFLKENGVDAIAIPAYPKDEEAMYMRDLWINQKVPPLAVLTLILHLRKRMIQETILPALRQGKVVISDRWNETTLAYQGSGQGLPRELVKEAFKHYQDWDELLQYEELTKVTTRDGNEKSMVEYLYSTMNAYFTIHLDISLETSRKRVGVREKLDAFEKADDDFFERVYQGFYWAYANLHRGTVNIFNADRDLDQVKESIADVLRVKYLR